MTSIDFLFEKLWEVPKDKLTWHSILNKAKEMYKKEKETLYTEVQVKKMIDDALINYEIGYKPQLPLQEICISCDEQKGTHKICMDCIGKMIKENQQEISDEEIEKFADEELGTIRTDFDFGVIQGMKWYREQLK